MRLARHARDKYRSYKYYRSIRQRSRRHFETNQEEVCAGYYQSREGDSSTQCGFCAGNACEHVFPTEDSDENPFVCTLCGHFQMHNGACAHFYGADGMCTFCGKNINQPVEIIRVSVQSIPDISASTSISSEAPVSSSRDDADSEPQPSLETLPFAVPCRLDATPAIAADDEVYRTVEIDNRRETLV